jgi:hypothetical protein|tara:strand:+ start:1074 stop:1232 length:159 start_codon:yes stop_codon:yes gene_type:complete
MSKQIGKSSAIEKYCEENEIPFFKSGASNSLELVIEELNAFTEVANKMGGKI